MEEINKHEEKKETRYEHIAENTAHEELSPAQAASREDSAKQEQRFKNMERATDTRFDLEEETAKKIHEKLNEEIDNRTLEIVKARLTKESEEIGQEYLKNLDGLFALNKAKELGWLDDEKDQDEKLRKLYNLRSDLLGMKKEAENPSEQKYNTLLSGESRLLILEIFNEKAEELQKSKDRTKASELLSLREKITEQIIGKKLLKKILEENSNLNKTEDEIEEEIQALIAKKISDRKENFNNDYRYSYNREEGEKWKYVKSMNDNENNYKIFIEENIEKLEDFNNGEKIKNRKDLPHLLACIQTEGYQIKESKALTKFNRTGLKVSRKKELILIKDREKINLTALNDDELEETLKEIVESAHKKWKEEFAPEAETTYNLNLTKKITDKKELIINGLANKDSEYLDQYYEKLETKLLNEQVFKNYKEKNPEQVKKILGFFKGKDAKIKDMILSGGNLEFEDDDPDNEKNLEVIRNWEDRFGMLGSEKLIVSGYDKKLPEKSKFKNAKNKKSGLIQWLLGLELSKTSIKKSSR